MRIVVGSDERTSLTDAVVEGLREKGHEIDLVGPLAGSETEWAEVSVSLAGRVARGEAEMGVLFCWTGTGASIAANKVPGARAALCADAETARGARRWNHANVLVMSLRATSEAVGAEIVDAFLSEPEGEEPFDVRNVAALDVLDRGRGG